MQNRKPQHIMNTNMNNKVQLIGHLGNDPELKDVGNGKRVLRFRMATNERYKGADGEWKDNSQWHPVVVWGKQAEKLAAQVTKGSGLVVAGESDAEAHRSDAEPALRPRRSRRGGRR